ncbi:hypothetical protein [Tenuifilum osseticum]|uniref:hypothetical protein n=1 Tax=Tenuifilum osseticum TaxID=3374723 RepID=UPI0034E5EA7D
MKKFFILSLVVLVANVFFTSCSKDEDTIKQAFKYNGKTYKIDKGYYVPYGEVSTGVYNIDLILVSNEVEGDTETGNAVYFEIFTNNEEQLPVGTYTFNQSEDAFTFDIGRFYLNYDFSSSSGTIVNVKSGTVKIEKSGTTYKISIDCVSTSDLKIEGSFEGSLTLDMGKKK